MNESELIHRCLNKEPKAEKLLWDRYAPKLFGVCIRHTRTESEAEEVLQEGFIRIYQNLHLYKNTGSFEAWLKRIMINTALTHIRLTRKMTFEADIETIDNQMKFSSDPLRQIEIKQLLQLVQKLPEPHKTVLNLFAIDGFSHAEIGEMLSISEASSRVTLHRAKQILIKVAGSDLMEEYKYGKR